jgi:putative membrane protein
MRGLNEVPTVLLLAIVLLAVFKNTLPVSAAIWALVGMTGALAVFFQLYARHRRKQALIEVRD